MERKKLEAPRLPMPTPPFQLLRPYFKDSADYSGIFPFLALCFKMVKIQNGKQPWPGGSD